MAKAHPIELIIFRIGQDSDCVGLLNFFGDYLQDFFFPALQQLAEWA